MVKKFLMPTRWRVILFLELIVPFSFPFFLSLIFDFWDQICYFYPIALIWAYITSCATVKILKSRVDGRIIIGSFLIYTGSTIIISSVVLLGRVVISPVGSLVGVVILISAIYWIKKLKKSTEIKDTVKGLFIMDIVFVIIIMSLALSEIPPLASGRCDRLKGEDRDLCFYLKAIDKVDVSLCWRIYSLSTRTQCIADIAAKTKDLSLCDELDEWHRNQCRKYAYSKKFFPPPPK